MSLVRSAALMLVLAVGGSAQAQNADAGAPASEDERTLGAHPNDYPAKEPVTGGRAGEDPTKPTSAEDPSVGRDLLNLLIVLGIVLGAVYITLNYGLRRMMGLPPPGRGGADAPISVLQRLPLDQKRSLFVVKAGTDYLLLGGGDASVTLLCKLDAEVAQKIEADRPKPPSAFLQKLLSRKGSPPPTA